MTTTKKVPVPEELQPVEINGRENLPAVGQRCLFVLRSWKDRPVLTGFRAYGYRDDEDSVYLPLHKVKLSILCVKQWRIELGEHFYNGHI